LPIAIWLTINYALQVPWLLYNANCRSLNYHTAKYVLTNDAHYEVFVKTKQNTA